MSGVEMLPKPSQVEREATEAMMKGCCTIAQIEAVAMEIRFNSAKVLTPFLPIDIVNVEYN